MKKINTEQFFVLITSKEFYNTKKQATGKFDIGDYLEAKGFEKDLSEIDIPAYLKDLEENSKVTYDYNSYSDDIITLYPFPEGDVSTKDQMYSLLEHAIFFNSQLRNLVLPNLGKNLEIKKCILHHCHWPEKMGEHELKLEQCDIKDMHFPDLFNQRLEIKKCKVQDCQIKGYKQVVIQESKLSNVRLSDCQFNKDVVIRDCEFDGSQIENNTFEDLILLNVKGLAEEDFSKNTFQHPTKLINAFTAWDPLILKMKLKNPNIPIIAVSYSFADTIYCDTMIQWFTEQTKRGAHIILFDNRKEFSEARYLLEQHKIDGVYIPGGSDIPKEYYSKETDVARDDPRTNFELALLDWAEDNGIDVLGICRGMQLIGVREGMALIDIDEQQHLEEETRVYPDNVIFDMINHKYQKHVVAQTDKAKLYQDCITVKKDQEGNILYFQINRHCAHHQSLDKATHTQPSRIQMIAEAGTIPELIQVQDTKHKSIMYGIQNHPEAIYQDNKLAHSLLKIFLRRARAHRKIKTLKAKQKISAEKSSFFKKPDSGAPKASEPSPPAKRPSPGSSNNK